ncbi:hypothetical protein KY493_13405 [Brevundimonas sp. PAMC22021]|nr:hypothetical protein KY493_13405 [Brevundimonas sp. PAMC22021]
MVVIRKYANRRLYDTRRSAYVTLDDLARMVREEVRFVVEDARTHDDLTRQVLMHVLYEQESRGEPVLPAAFLRRLIGIHGRGAASPGDLEASLARPGPRPTPAADEMQGSLAEIRQQMDEMRARLDRLAPTEARPR